MIRWLAFLLLILIAVLQYQLWWSSGGRQEIKALQNKIQAQNKRIAKMLARNEQLQAEVQSLKTDLKAVEAKARYELGLIKPGEQFVQLIKKSPP